MGSLLRWRPILAGVIAALAATACSGSEGAAVTTPLAATTTTATAPPATTAAATTDPPPTTPTTIAAPSLGFEFRSTAADTEQYRYEFSYPILIHPDQAIADAVNGAIEEWVRDAIRTVSVAQLERQASFVAEIAPELLNDDVFSLSGITVELLNESAGTISSRVAWIFSLEDGIALTASDLFVDGDLAALAAAARERLVADVLEDESAIVSPDGLLPDPANFDAVWLTANSIGVGFDQFQVAAGDRGSPAVMVPFTALLDTLLTTGVLAPLQSSSSLPEL